MARIDGETYKSHEYDIARRLLEQSGNITDETLIMLSGLTQEEIDELRKEYEAEEAEETGDGSGLKN